jgi:hypothetical protein
MTLDSDKGTAGGLVVAILLLRRIVVSDWIHLISGYSRRLVVIAQ